MSFKKKTVLFNLILLLTFLVDRLTKWLAINFWDKEGFFVIHNFWQTKLLKNYKLSFSIPVSYPWNLLITIPVLLLVVYFLVRAYQKQEQGLIFPLSLISLGAISNLIDRLRYGFVIDFINWDFGFPGNNPSFNIADVLIISGILLLVIPLFVKNDHETSQK